MCIWPFFLGKFVELPYTLVQDYTLTSILGQTAPDLWLEKVKFISRYRGMALVNSHPDYLQQASTWKVYREFLLALSHQEVHWHALTHQVSRWWRQRSSGSLGSGQSSFPLDVIRMKHGQLEFGG